MVFRNLSSQACQCSRARPILVTVLLMNLLTPGVARENAGTMAEHAYDPKNAEEINGLCAGCHGEFGEGGGDGEYPRLAGLPAKYLANQLRKFKSRERPSIAMAIYATDRELPEADLLDISTYLSEIELLPRMPVLDPSLPALEKLRIGQRVFNVPRLDGDTTRGEDIYDRQCRRCHGEGGCGRAAFPPLAGQFSEYLRLQIENFQSGVRIKKSMEKYILPLTPDDIDDLLAYLSVVDD